jgi:hypothetical protein
MRRWPACRLSLDTTRTAFQLVVSGIADRYPGARIILASGTMPPKPADILASFQRFYFDTALSSCPAALPSLKSFANEDAAINYGNARTMFPRLAVEQRIQEAVRTDRLTK